MYRGADQSATRKHIISPCLHDAAGEFQQVNLNRSAPSFDQGDYLTPMLALKVVKLPLGKTRRYRKG